MKFLFSFRFIFLVSFFLSACLPNGVQIPQSPALRFLERKSGLIAYVGNDGNIHLIDQSGASAAQLTTDVTPENRNSVLYRLPAWSRDSNQLAFMRHEREGESLISEIFVANTTDEITKKILSGSDFTIYLNWSPDNQNIGLLTSAASGQTIVLQNLSIDGAQKTIVDAGNPFYWSWAPDGKTMLVHKNGGNPNAPQQIAFLKNNADEVLEFVLEERPASFQAPAWSPSGEYILISTISADNKKQLVLTDSTGANPKTISEIPLNTIFAWAPDSEQFAYIIGKDSQLQGGAIGELHVADVFGSEEIVIDENVFGFFWSPDSSQLAYFIPFVSTSENEDGSTTGQQQTLYFSLNILDIASGESKEIAVYQPTEEFFSIMPFIDQYHQSITIWSPDSNNLVISFLTQEGIPAIAIVPASGITQPRLLAEGSFAVWSWE